MPAPLIFWFRRDFRLSDNPGLSAAAATGRPIIPLFILDPETEALGAAPKWRLGEGIRAFAATLESVGSKLILRQGSAEDVLRAVIAETGAEAVHWSRLYDPVAKARDAGVKSALKSAGLEAVSHPGHVLFEPWTVQTGTGGFYKVYTPFWKSVRGRDLPTPLAAPDLNAPASWPKSDTLTDWHLDAAMRRGASVVAKYAQIGSAAAEARLEHFLEENVARYGDNRDRLDIDGTSRLSQNLALGEVSPRVCWFAGMRALHEGKPGAETFLKEIVWRDFAYHLIHHTPHIVDQNWRPEWNAFGWRGESAAVERWRKGRTGEPVIDAAMRELYVTGTMHNRARMLVASYLTKHLLTDWRIGLKWFEDCLIDWDPAANAMGWQWAAGCGPDAAPYFRVFNPATQAEKFDPLAVYRKRWVAELAETPGEEALDYFAAVPRRWGARADAPYPEPLVDLKAGREAALAAYQSYKAKSAA